MERRRHANRRDQCRADGPVDPCLSGHGRRPAGRALSSRRRHDGTAFRDRIRRGDRPRHRRQHPCRLYVPRAKLLSRRRDLSVRLFARRLYGAQPRRIHRGLRRAEAPKARRSGPGLAILSRSRPSLAARLHAVEPFGLSRRRHDQIPRRLGHGGRARNSRVAVREARQAAIRLSQHRSLLRGEARLSRHGDRGASGGVHADAVDGDGAGGRSHRASVVRRRAFRCRRGLRHARPGRHSAGLDGEKGRGRRAGARLVLPARSEQPRSPRANPRLAHARLRGGPHKADMAGDPGATRRRLVRPVAPRSLARSRLRAGRRARKAARRHQRVDPRERRPALRKNRVRLRGRRDRRQPGKKTGGPKI